MAKGLLAVPVLLIALAPVGQAHGPVNAGEVETLVVKDELSDLFYTTGGYDLGEIYLGEAHVPGVGDGFYVHTLLFGSVDATRLDAPHRVAFTFTSANGATITRTLTTSDGASFDSDFDALAYEAGAEEVEVQRAFVKATPDFAPGRTIAAVRAESYLGDDLRDVAPGGVLVPGSGGAAEIPMGDSQQVAGLPLVGPTKYVKATLDGGDGRLVVHVESLLKKGDQHVMLRLPDDATGWRLVPDGPAALEVKANGTHAFTLAVPRHGEPATLDVLTDIGGRVPIELRDGTATLGEQSIALAGPAAGKESPPVGAVVLLGVLALGATLRRR